jgi:predicted Zn finger-like uncharacterized protein
MHGPNPDDTLLLIRCPSCGQRFKVGEDLRGRTVECGGCEHRFRINDEVIVRGKKFYPGERTDTGLNRFQRVPLSVAPPVMGTAAVRYGQAPDPAILEPASPQRIIAGIIGGVGIAIMALIIILGARRGGALDGITTENRMIMAGFTCLLGTLLLIYANPKARAKAIGAGLLASICLITLPLFFTDGSKPLENRDVERILPLETPPVKTIVPQESDMITELRRRIGTDPLTAEIERLAAEGSTRHAVGLWLRDLQERNRFLIMDYILRTTGADPQSHYYPRGNGDFLMVVTGINMSLDDLAKVSTAVGSVERILPEIAVIEVRVNNENFVEGPVEKLTDRNSPGFYDLNKRELESIDLDRIERAVKRLAEAEPKIYRSDITGRLISLLATPEVKFKGPICKALIKWSDDPGPAAEAALKEADKLLKRKSTIPEEMISLIVKAKKPGVIPIIDALWSESPTRWEMQYAEIGQVAEPNLLKGFPQTQGWHRQSAVRLLGKVGGSNSLPVLEAAKTDADPELRVLLDKSIQSIRSRLGS